VIAGILGVTAIGAKPIMAVPFFVISIVETCGVQPIAAVIADTAAFVWFHGHPIAHSEFGDALA
jgi:hypothetical protein